MEALPGPVAGSGGRRVGGGQCEAGGAGRERRCIGGGKLGARLEGSLGGGWEGQKEFQEISG